MAAASHTFASARLRGDRDVVLAAVRSQRHTQPPSRNSSANRQSVAEEGGRGPEGLRCGADDMADDMAEEEGVALAKPDDGDDGDDSDDSEPLHHASEALRADRGVVLAAVARSGWSALRLAAEPFRADREVIEW